MYRMFSDNENGFDHNYIKASLVRRYSPTLSSSILYVVHYKYMTSLIIM